MILQSAGAFALGVKTKLPRVELESKGNGKTNNYGFYYDTQLLVPYET